MEIALLHGQPFPIDERKNDLFIQGKSRKEVLGYFEDNYRIFSKKGAFICINCREPVNMNLTKEEGRPFYFKHNDGNECTYSRNSKTYEKQQKGVENKPKKDIGLTIFREILQGQLRPHNVQIERSYLFKKELSFIPDFILRFPEKEELWAVDYLTYLDKGTAKSYRKHLEKRRKTYEKEGFKPFFFIDNEWLALDQNSGLGSLLQSENYATNKTDVDKHWEYYIKEELNDEHRSYIRKKLKDADSEFKTKSICYVDVNARICKIIRLIEGQKSNNTLTFFSVGLSSIPLERALNLDLRHQSFLLFDEDESGLRKQFKLQLEKGMEELKREDKVRWEKQTDKIVESSTRTTIHTKNRWRTEEELEQLRKVAEVHRDEEDLELQREMEERARRAADRPVELDENKYNELKNNPIGLQRYLEKVRRNQSKPREIDPVDQLKKEKFREKILAFSVSGSAYINGETHIWKSYVLKWINDQKTNNEYIISLEKLIQDMKDSGFTFTQKDKLVKVPLRTLIDYYQKELRKDLKMVIKVVYID